jgi:hypothetical protein
MAVDDDWDAPDDGPSNSDDSEEEIRSSSSDDEQPEEDGVELDHRGNPLDKPKTAWQPAKQRGGVGAAGGGEREAGYYVRKLAQAGFADVQPDAARVHKDGDHVQSAGGWVDYEYQLDPELELPNSVALSLDVATLPASAATRSDVTGGSRQGSVSAGGSYGKRASAKRERPPLRGRTPRPCRRRPRSTAWRT